MEAPRHTPETMKWIQNDVHSLEAEDFVRDVIAPWVERLDELDIRGPGADRIRQAAREIVSWDFTCTIDSRPAALYHALFAQLLREIFEPRLGEDLWLLLFENWNEAIMATERVIRDPKSGWMEGKRLDDVLLRALTRAIADLGDRLGPDPALHPLTMPHPLGAHPRLGPALNLGPFPSRGTSFTVNNGQFFYAYAFKQVAGPGLRQIVDLADLEGSLFVVNSGQSGNIASPHHADLTSVWLEGEYVPMTMDIPGVSTLTLKAQPKG
jgi:penicillin amidase